MRKIGVIFIIVIAFTLIFSFNVKIILADPSTAYYVSNDGDDSNTGTSTDSPWKTITKVNAELNGGVITEGDDIYFNRGDTFNDAQLQLRTGGTSDNPMIFGSYGTGAKPIFNLNGASAIYCNWNIDNVTLQDINISGNDGTNSINFDSNTDASNIYFFRIEGYDTGHTICMRNVNYYRIENCKFQPNNADRHGISIGIGCKNGIILNCTIKECKDGINLHFVGDDSNPTQAVGDNHWFKNVTVNSCSEEGFDIAGGIGCENILIENCEAYDCSNTGLGIGHRTANVIVDNFYSYDHPVGNMFITETDGTVIIRNSIFQNWSSGKNGIVKSLNGKWMKNVLIYNNVIVSDGIEDHIQINDEQVSNLIVKNNIFYSTQSNSPGRFINLLPSATFENINSNWSHNLWWRGDGGNGDDTWWNDDNGGYTWTQWQAMAEVNNDIRADPIFVNDLNNFNIEVNSPCIDAGDWLTTTSGSGSGKSIIVDEANYFHTGYGLTDGDNVFIGNDLNLEIVTIDYNNNIIIVNRSISWSEGEYVSLSSYNGLARDIGAYESNYLMIGDTPDITNIACEVSDPLDTDKSFGWINISAEISTDSEMDNVRINIICSNGTTINKTMEAIGAESYYFNTSSIFTNHGDYNYYIWANDINGNSSISTTKDFSMPPNWDVNKDRKCTILDLILISNHYNETGKNGWIREDIDNNGIVQVNDLNLVVLHYFETW